MSDKDDTCTLSDSDLIDKCHQWISDLAESGGKKWTLRVPIDMSSDPDMLFAELCDRFTGRRPRRPENPDGFAVNGSAGVPEKKFELFKGNFISLVDRILRDKGASNKEVFDAMETAFKDLKSEISVSSPSPLEAETADKKLKS